MARCSRPTRRWTNPNPNPNPNANPNPNPNQVLHKRRLIVFGGVHDEDTADGEGLISSFYNDLHSYSLDANKVRTNPNPSPHAIPNTNPSPHPHPHPNPNPSPGSNPVPSPEPKSSP